MTRKFCTCKAIASNQAGSEESKEQSRLFKRKWEYAVKCVNDRYCVTISGRMTVLVL